jgi:hypothetical protein
VLACRHRDYCLSRQNFPFDRGLEITWNSESETNSAQDIANAGGYAIITRLRFVAARNLYANLRIEKLGIRIVNSVKRRGLRMRQFFLGCALIVLCALPFRLKRVEAGAGIDEASSKVRTVARGVATGGIATDFADRIYFSANNRVYRISPDLRIGANGRAISSDGLDAIAGSGERGSLGDGGPAILAQLDLSTAGASTPASAKGNLASDISGNLFLADTLNDTVRRIDADSQLISSVAGRWGSGNLSATSSEQILRPAAVAVDVSGNVYIVGNDQLWRLDPSGSLSQLANVVDPVAFAVSRDGDSIAVATRGGEMFVVFERSTPGHYQAAFTWPATNQETLGDELAVGQADNQGEPASRASRYSGLAFDASGKIFAAKGNGNIIERFDFKAPAHATIAGNGRAGYSGDEGAPLEAEFNAPGALAIDRDGNLLIADTGNLAIREITHAAAVAGVTLTPNTFTFSNEPTGGSSAPEVFTLANNSSVQVTGIAIDFTGTATPPDFTQTSTCATTLDAGSSCTISVVFSPQATGNRSAALHVADSDPTSPQTAALSGFADDYELALQSGNTDTLTIVQGGTANYNLAVVPDNSFSGTVTVQCPVGLPLDVSCGLATGTASGSSGGASGSSGSTTLALTVAPGAPQNFTLALSTMAKNQDTLSPRVLRRPRSSGPELGLAILGTVAALFSALRVRNRRSRSRWRPIAMSSLRFRALGLVVAITTLIFAATGCGGSGTPTLIQKPNPGTPAGTYHFNVIGASQGASRAFTITLIVQSP